MAKYQPYPIDYPHMWNYSPDDGELHFYMYGSATIEEIMERAEEKFGSSIGLTITPERIHTRCLTYDLYDPGDYDDFLLISKT